MRDFFQTLYEYVENQMKIEKVDDIAALVGVHIYFEGLTIDSDPVKNYIRWGS